MKNLDKGITNKTTKKRGYNPVSLANLKPFGAHNCANPHGRPRKVDCLLSCIKEELRKKTLNGQTNEQLIASVLVSKAAHGDTKSIELMMAYLHAKPAQGIDLNKGEGITIHVIEETRKEEGG